MDKLLKELKAMKKDMKPNTYRTIKGQILSGNEKAARVGMTRIKERQKGSGRYDHKTFSWK